MMINTLKSWSNNLLHFLYPHLCAGCGNDLTDEHQSICFQCYTALPETGFANNTGNPIEKIFYGRLDVEEAMSSYYFTKTSALQNMIHALKYRNNQAAGIQLGKWMGIQLIKSNRFKEIDYLIPMPMYPGKEKKRGYNQATVLCRGISEATGIPVHENIVARNRYTDTQTRKGRNERWINVDGSFAINLNSGALDRHFLLVDDVITTGATLEACGAAIKEIPTSRLSIATLAWASDD